MSSKYKVSISDVDGSSSRVYKTRAAAVARFEEMLGYTFAQAMAEHFCDWVASGKPVLAPEAVTHLRGVSMYGTVVVFKELIQEAA